MFPIFLTSSYAKFRTVHPWVQVNVCSRSSPCWSTAFTRMGHTWGHSDLDFWPQKNKITSSLRPWEHLQLICDNSLKELLRYRVHEMGQAAGQTTWKHNACSPDRRQHRGIIKTVLHEFLCHSYSPFIFRQRMYICDFSQLFPFPSLIAVCFGSDFFVNHHDSDYMINSALQSKYAKWRHVTWSELLSYQ